MPQSNISFLHRGKFSHPLWCYQITATRIFVAIISSYQVADVTIEIKDITVMQIPTAKAKK